MPQDRSLPYVIGLVVLIAVAVVLFVAFPSLFLAPNYVPSGQPDSSQQPSASGKPTIAQAQAIVMPKSELTLRAITRSVDIPISSVPVLFRNVVPSDAKNVLAKRLTDKAGKTGYMIIFDLLVPIQTADRIMMLAFGQSWKVVLNTYTPTFGLLELTGNGYDVQTQLSAVKDTQIKVVIRAQAK